MGNVQDNNLGSFVILRAVYCLYYCGINFLELNNTEMFLLSVVRCELGRK